MTNQPLADEDARHRYASWLLESLKHLYGQIEREEPAWMEYGGVRCYFGGDQSELVAQMYGQAVPVDERLAFRVAIGDALLSAVNDPAVPPEAMVDLLHAIARLGAVEAIHTLPTLVRSTTWPTVVVKRDNSSILFHVVTILGSLVPRHPVAEVTRQLLDDPSFDESLLLWGLVLLAQCEPAEAARTLAEYADRVSSLWARALARNQLLVAKQAFEEWADDTLLVAGESWINQVRALTAQDPVAGCWLTLALHAKLDLEPHIDPTDPSSSHLVVGTFKGLGFTLDSPEPAPYATALDIYMRRVAVEVTSAQAYACLAEASMSSAPPPEEAHD
jgi:hypothetical protein